MVWCGATGFRSRCLALAKRALFQLSYSPFDVCTHIICYISQTKSIIHSVYGGQVGIEPTTSRTQSENHATRPLTHWFIYIFITHTRQNKVVRACVRAPRIELGTHCVLGNCHNQLDQARAIKQYHMKLEGFEPPTFGSGIRRATNCAIASYV